MGFDSNTPEGWQHYFHGYESAISFVKSSNQNIVKVNTQDKGGLYKKTGSFQNITCKVKGRLIRGNVILLGVVGYGGYAYVITLMPKVWMHAVITYHMILHCGMNMKCARKGRYFHCILTVSLWQGRFHRKTSPINVSRNFYFSLSGWWFGRD